MSERMKVIMTVPACVKVARPLGGSATAIKRRDQMAQSGGGGSVWKMPAILLAGAIADQGSILAMRKFIAGNWKMNGRLADMETITAIAEAAVNFPDVDTALCLPATLIAAASQANPGYCIGAQDCHAAVSGAHTGCLSAAMLKEAGASLTIIGHSERRAAQHESNAEVRAKALAAKDARLSAIICVGETEAERDAGMAVAIVLQQLDQSLPDEAASDWLSVAYEPVWAIGTGRIPSTDDVAQMHAAIRADLETRFGSDGAAMRILYGGSMNGDNAAGLLAIANVDGGLIGGASLSAEKFIPIVAAAATA
jgi:triosephosphate isomerase (TIM)